MISALLKPFRRAKPCDLTRAEGAATRIYRKLEEHWDRTESRMMAAARQAEMATANFGKPSPAHLAAGGAAFHAATNAPPPASLSPGGMGFQPVPSSSPSSAAPVSDRCSSSPSPSPGGTGVPPVSSDCKHLCVCIDEESTDECLYIDGRAWPHRGEVTVYATDIAEQVSPEEAIRFEHRCVTCPESGWPDNLTDLSLADAPEGGAS